MTIVDAKKILDGIAWPPEAIQKEPKSVLPVSGTPLGFGQPKPRPVLFRSYNEPTIKEKVDYCLSLSGISLTRYEFDGNLLAPHWFTVFDDLLFFGRIRWSSKPNLDSFDIRPGGLFIKGHEYSISWFIPSAFYYTIYLNSSCDAGLFVDRNGMMRGKPGICNGDHGFYIPSSLWSDIGGLGGNFGNVNRGGRKIFVG